MRCADPIFEHNFTGENMIGAISWELYGKERFELELFSRLREVV